jgi:phosphoglucomutase
MNMKKILMIICWLPLIACGQQPLEKKMTRAERKKYYADYNSKFTQQQWDSIARKNEPPLETKVSLKPVSNSISFSIKNKSLFTRTFLIDGNVLKVGGRKRNFYGFAEGTRIYSFDKSKANKRGKVLHTVSAKDEGAILEL